MQRDTSIDFLKGLAIMAVIGLHVIPYFLNERNVLLPESRPLLSAMNFFRFSVPVFVALSGVMLARKYQDESVRIGSFLQKRVVKLIPLYLFWTGIIYLIVHLVPGWSGFVDSFPLWQVFVLGRGDYHLYFVPMIVSLYLAFPYLLWLTKKTGLVMVFFSLLIQIWFYWYLRNVVNHDATASFFQTDQQQYVFFLSWFFYFVLGIYLGLTAWVRNLWIGVVTLPLVAVSLRWVQADTHELLKQGSNIIFSTGFTRVSVIFYSAASLIAGSILFSRPPPHFSKLSQSIVYIGKQSFLIYLSHTIFLRVIFGVTLGHRAPESLVLPVAIWIVALLISGKVTKMADRLIG